MHNVFINVPKERNLGHIFFVGFSVLTLHKVNIKLSLYLFTL